MWIVPRYFNQTGSLFTGRFYIVAQKYLVQYIQRSNPGNTFRWCFCVARVCRELINMHSYHTKDVCVAFRRAANKEVGKGGKKSLHKIPPFLNVRDAFVILQT